MNKATPRFNMTKRKFFMLLCCLAVLLLAGLFLLREPSCMVTFTEKNVPLSGATFTMVCCQDPLMRSCVLDENGRMKISWPRFEKFDMLISSINKDGRKIGNGYAFQFTIRHSIKRTINLDISPPDSQ